MQTGSDRLLGVLIMLLGLVAVSLLVLGVLEQSIWASIGFVMVITAALSILAYKGALWTREFDEKGKR